MNVPPYIPPPIEIPGNVTTKPHRVIVGFVRRVALSHYLSALIVAAVAVFGPSAENTTAPAVAALVSLALLSLLRRVGKVWQGELAVSLPLFAAFLVVLGLTARSLLDDGYPVGAPLVGLTCALVYTVLCGRDLSYVGMYVLSLLASTALLVAMGLWRGMLASDLWFAASLNTLYLTYYVYDLASLLSRRRLGEEIGAMIDLYRDALNFLSYSVRVVRHWRRHRIWSK